MKVDIGDIVYHFHHGQGKIISVYSNGLAADVLFNNSEQLYMDIDSLNVKHKSSNDGFYPNGKNKVTGTLFDNKGYNKDGFNCSGKHRLTRTLYDPDGYDWDGWHHVTKIFKTTGSHFDPDGYDCDGFDKYGLNESGHDRLGFKCKGHDNEEFNRAGLDQEGFNRAGFDRDGFNRGGFNQDGLNRAGFDRDGFNRAGFDRDGFDRAGFDRDGFDRDRLNRAGFDREGFNRGGFNQEGFDRKGGDLKALPREQFLELFSADWLVKQWGIVAGESPQHFLPPRLVLDFSVHNHLAKSKNFGELLDLLTVLCNCSWYETTETIQSTKWDHFFRPEEWPSQVFTSDKDIESYIKFKSLLPHLKKVLKKYWIKAKAVAIDLESDGKKIFEFGWASSFSSGIKKNLDGLTQVELYDAIHESLLLFRAPYIIGHNLLDWDLRILNEHKAQISPESLHWDTLIASFILEPWNKSHALNVGENAHQADADAKACYMLFEEQVQKLDFLNPIDFDTKKAVEILFQNPSLLSNIQGREYPTYLTKGSTALLYPENRDDEIRWHSGCHIEYLSAERKLIDPVLSPKICNKLKVSQQDIAVKVVAIVVSDASLNGVHVRLSDLPSWLVGKELKESLQGAHIDCEIKYKSESKAIYLAEDLFKLPIEKIECVKNSKEIKVSYMAEVIAVWQKICCKTLKQQDIEKKYAEATKNRYKSALFPIHQNGNQKEWLFYDPPGLGEKSPAWSILPMPPTWLSIDKNNKELDKSSLNRKLAIPCWKDGHANQLDIDRIFVSPDTLNRELYISEVTHSILNIFTHIPEDSFLLIAMRWPAEASYIQNALCNLSLSTNHPGTHFRRLEKIKNRNHRIIAFSVDEVADYLHAAETLKIKLQLIIDEAPLNHWYAQLKSQEFISTTKDKLLREEDKKADDDNYENIQVGNQITIDSKSIIQASSLFLQGWVYSLLKQNSLNKPVILLDSRLSHSLIVKSLNIPITNIPYFSLEEILDHQKTEIFQKILFPHREIKAPPKDYETYRSFLRENWGFDDFRQRTQKPAIEKILQTNRDILLRLPTGEGKSIVFHLPALLHAHYSGRLTVVITPLRALMRDQVEGLWRKHFTKTVDYLSGGRDTWVNYETYQGILDGRIKLIFVAPERFRVSQFVEVLDRRRQMDSGLEFIVFDEAHCISEWGFEFRPDYLYAAQYIADKFKTDKLPGNPTRLLLTSATITQRNRRDLERELAIGKAGDYEDIPEEMPHPIQPFILLESFNIIEESRDETQKLEKIIEILDKLDLKKSAALIFVRTRKECHKISEFLNSHATSYESTSTPILALPFHAGLSEMVKTEACQFLNERRANVLVCTKAFGMGMDIPHLHACIHLKPPTFIEDYLQEVGRIGRDEKERLQAHHEQVAASLLYNQENFQKNLTSIHDKTIKPPALQDFFAYCLENAVNYADIERSICIVPTKVDLREEELDEGQVTNCLFWLERMKALRIEGRIPPLLEIKLNKYRLKKCATGSTTASQIAKALLETIDASLKEANTIASENSDEAKDSGFGRLVKGLLRGIFAFVNPSVSTGDMPSQVYNGALETTPEDKMINASVPISTLTVASGGLSLDELFSGLLELQKTSSIEVRKFFTVLKSSFPNSEVFWELLEKAVQRLLEKNNKGIELLPRKQFESELREWYQDYFKKKNDFENTDENDNKISNISRQIDMEVYRAMGTSLRILRYAGIDIKESLSDDGVINYARYIDDSLRSQAHRNSRDTISSLRKLQDYLYECLEKSSDSDEISFRVLLTDMLELMGENIQLGDLRKLIKLVDSAGSFNFEGSLDDWVSLVTLLFHKRLEPHVPEMVELSSTQEIYKEMLEKYDLQILRAQAMSLLAIMPAKDRKLFIDEYFLCQGAGELKNLLEKTVGNIDDTFLRQTPELLSLLNQVRQERFGEEVKKLNEAQKSVCKAPYDKTLLVNAGPGSGKTRVLMMRCAHLIHVQRINPSQILVLAFNRAVVFEIRDRLNDLFRSLGYGSYTNRLDISTFHSFALRHFPATDRYDEDAVGNAVHSFAKKATTDEAFISRIAGRYKAILIDEFQDMNEDFYSVVDSLFKHCRGGGMVIGDDDQDILSWNRRNLNKLRKSNHSLDATPYFNRFLKSHAAEQHHLKINYRSSPEIVLQANRMIKKVSKKMGFKRMKEKISLTAHRRDNFPKIKKILSPDTYIDITKDVLKQNENVAILCRSNRECRRVYEGLIKSEIIPKGEIELLGAEDFPLYQLRHVGTVLDLCKNRKEYDFVEIDVWQEILSEYEKMNFANRSTDLSYLKSLYLLVRQEVGRPRIKDIQDFIQEMRVSDIERLKAKIKNNTSSRLTVATIHKVKGLEYDTVLVMPSSESFPFDGIRTTVSTLDSAEESRLYYVAMTRARNHLRMGCGPREKSWYSGTPYCSENNSKESRLKGSPKELFVSWPGFSNQVNNNTQLYIEKKVHVGDPLILKGKHLIHVNKPVGFLSNKAFERLGKIESLRVSNVIRYTCGNYFKEKNQKFWEDLDNKVKKQGWFYLVLAEEL